MLNTNNMLLRIVNKLSHFIELLLSFLLVNHLKITKDIAVKIPKTTKRTPLLINTKNNIILKSFIINLFSILDNDLNNPFL